LLARPQLRRIFAEVALDGLAEAVLGAGAFAVDAVFFDKRSLANWAVPAHQDVDMVPLSHVNEAQVRALFAARDLGVAMSLLAGCEVSEAAPLLERIRSAAVRASGGAIGELREALALAALDWRDLLVAAEFADDVGAHMRWIPQRFGVDVVERWMAGDRLPGVLYGLNEPVQVRRDDGAVVWGAIITLTRLEPSPRYLVELGDGRDIEVWQRQLVSAE
jgi:hypothetical protein